MFWESVYTVSGPLTWKDFHLLAGRGAEEASEPQPIPSVIVGYEKEWLSVSPYTFSFWVSSGIKTFTVIFCFSCVDAIFLIRACFFSVFWKRFYEAVGLESLLSISTGLCFEFWSLNRSYIYSWGRSLQQQDTKKKWIDVLPFSYIFFLNFTGQVVIRALCQAAGCGLYCCCPWQRLHPDTTAGFLQRAKYNIWAAQAWPALPYQQNLTRWYHAGREEGGPKSGWQTSGWLVYILRYV